MKKYLALLLIFTNPVFAEDFDLDKFMRNYGLSLFALEKLGDRQHFENHRFVRVENGELIIGAQGESVIPPKNNRVFK